MGGSSGTFRAGHAPAKVAQHIQRIASEKAAEFDVALGAEFARLLGRYNSRNTDETAERLAHIKAALGEELDGSFDTFFGGSVAKHTFVDGLSDVDSMLLISGKFAEATPSAMLSKITQTLAAALGSDVQVSYGQVAVTVKYPDGNEIQLVPCLESDGVSQLKVPAWENNAWSSIDPRQFRDGLTKRNDECGGKLIPTLKLAKAVNSTLPEAARLTGYHIESLGVAAFRGYEGEKTTVRMLPYFFKRASELVLEPIRDRTGQSVHVDEQLGPAGSPERRALSHALARIHQRMINASAAASRDRWLEILGE
jgi:hypothetical protein